MPLSLSLSRPKNKPRISITLHPRGKNSIGENRARLKYSAFHWGVLISPKHASQPSGVGEHVSAHVHFDVTDSIYVDPVTGESSDAWRFRVRRSTDPVGEFRILGRVEVGKVPLLSSGSGSGSRSGSGVGFEELVERVRERLGAIPLPRKEFRQEENCVSWTRAAIGGLGEMGVLGLGLGEGFEIEEFMDVALGFADECLASLGEKGMGRVLDYRPGVGKRVK
ncbi:uncharacterized protein DSM5745_07092 [Aspergillus mulundensis]|uniref:Uncharacterized protein n=1 Tax=Aspergillus mulundensis TaxID=1810919 RepID=A0A3D8RKD5_9EURO|nr:hypothetical protein DSM5745_07092 [Aspergillus mulundensis]RDW74430.1 hypothetical protein DSM5745_07092 [Aspergillus mulundensis]